MATAVRVADPFVRAAAEALADAWLRSGVAYMALRLMAWRDLFDRIWGFAS
jgi:hypothetical protein